MALNIKKGKALDTINFTPIIDVVFNLLIFFMVASEFAREDKSMQLQLPAASEAKPLTEQPQELVINVDASGRTFVEAREVDVAALDNILARAMNNNPHQSVIVRSDKRTSFDAFVQVMNLLKKNEVHSYDISTAADDAPNP